MSRVLFLFTGTTLVLSLAVEAATVASGGRVQWGVLVLNALAAASLTFLYGMPSGD